METKYLIDPNLYQVQLTAQEQQQLPQAIATYYQQRMAEQRITMLHHRLNGINTEPLLNHDYCRSTHAINGAVTWWQTTPQYRLTRAIEDLEQAIKTALRGLDDAAKLAYYHETIVPLNEALTMLTAALQIKGLGLTRMSLDKPARARQLQYFAEFEARVMQLPNITSSIWQKLARLLHLIAPTKTPLHAALADFKTAYHAVIGVSHGR